MGAARARASNNWETLICIHKLLSPSPIFWLALPQYFWQVYAQGRPSPLRPWCISILFQISPYFRQIFRLCGKFSIIFLFSSAKISDDLFSSTTNFEFPPIFPVSVHFPLVSRKLLFPPLFRKISLPVFEKFTCFYILYVYFVPSPTLTMMHLCITQCT